MNRQISGTLYLSPDLSNPERKITYRLKLGDNLIGSSGDCHVILNLSNIPPVQCNIHISRDTSATISAFDSEYGVLLSSMYGDSEILTPNFEYQLPSGLVFYLNNESKCFIEVEEEEESEENTRSTAMETIEPNYTQSQRNENENIENNENNESQIETMQMATQNDNDPDPVQNTVMLSQFEEYARNLKALQKITLNSTPAEELGNNGKTQSIENCQEENFANEDQREDSDENRSQIVITDKLSGESSPRGSIGDGDDHHVVREKQEEVQDTLRFSQIEDLYGFTKARKNFTQQNTVEISDDDIDIKEEKEEEDDMNNRQFQRMPYVKEEAEMLNPEIEFDEGDMEEEGDLEHRETNFNSNSLPYVSPQPNKMEEEKEVITTLELSETGSEQSGPNKNRSLLQSYQENTEVKINKGQEEENLEKEAEVNHLAEYLQKDKQARLKRMNQDTDKENENKKEVMDEQNQIDKTSQEPIKFNRKKVFRILSSQTPWNSQAGPSNKKEELEKKVQNKDTGNEKKAVKKRKTKQALEEDSYETKEQLLTRMDEVMFKEKGKGSRKLGKQQSGEENDSKVTAVTAEEKKQILKNLEAQIQQICQLVDDEEQEVHIDYRDREKRRSKVIEIDSDGSGGSINKPSQIVDEKPVYKKDFHKKARSSASSRIEEDDQQIKQTFSETEEKLMGMKNYLKVEIDKPTEKLRESIKTTKTNLNVEIEKTEVKSKESLKTIKANLSVEMEKSKELSKSPKKDLVDKSEEKWKESSKTTKSYWDVEIDQPESKQLLKLNNVIHKPEEKSRGSPSKTKKNNLNESIEKSKEFPKTLKNSINKISEEFDKPEQKLRESSRTKKSYWKVEIDKSESKELLEVITNNLIPKPEEKRREASKSPRRDLADRPEEKGKESSKTTKSYWDMQFEKPVQKSRGFLQSTKSHWTVNIAKPEVKYKESSKTMKNNVSMELDKPAEKSKEFLKITQNKMTVESDDRQPEENLKESSRSKKYNQIDDIEDVDDLEEIDLSEVTRKVTTDLKNPDSIMKPERKLELPQKVLEIGKRFSPLRVYSRERGIKLSFQGPCKEEFIHYDEIFKRKKLSQSKNIEDVPTKVQRLSSASIETSKERKVKADYNDDREKGHKQSYKANTKEKDERSEEEDDSSNGSEDRGRKIKLDSSSSSENPEEETKVQPKSQKFFKKKERYQTERDVRDIEAILARRKGIQMENLTKSKAGKYVHSGNKNVYEQEDNEDEEDNRIEEKYTKDRKEAKKQSKMEVEESETSQETTEAEQPKRGRKKKNTEKSSLVDFEKLTTVSKKFKISEDANREEENPNFKAIKRNSLQVAFTGFERDDEELEEIQEGLVKLGVKIIDESNKNFNVLVIDKFKRTIKFLLAVNRGAHIVRYQWAKGSVKQGGLLPFDDFAYVDKAAEARFKFKFARTLEHARSGRKSFLDGYYVYIPPNIKPSFDEIKLLVESADAFVVKTKPLKYREDLLILLNEDDKKNIKWAKDLRFQPYSLEMIYSGVLNQRLDLDRHKL